MIPPEPSNLKRPVDAENVTKESSDKRLRIDSDPSSDDAYHQPSDVALLYQFAHAAWQASNRHLTQAFIPAYVETEQSPDLPRIRLQDPLRPSRIINYRPDPQAEARVIELSLVALDTLGTLLKLPNLSDKERVTAGLLFGKIGFQTLQAQKNPGCLSSGIKLDYERVLADVQAQLAVCVSPLAVRRLADLQLRIARQIPYLALLSHEIEVIVIRVFLYQVRAFTSETSRLH